ncbi:MULTISPECIES: hypothetical protein [unclassified Mesotoga]|uniref:hypothetical protein n=1 Tax=unclassified Mesotoga TaxID=1184398 RepID=UPI001FAEEF79|nr:MULTISPECIES: hypothetical protein [unclassified Mesotoga]
MSLLLDTMRFLGWFNFILLLFNTSLFILRRSILKRSSKLENPPRAAFVKQVRFLAIVHPWTGSVLMLSALLHGYLATGGFILYSGSLVFLSVLAQFVVYLLGKYVPAMKNKWRPLHRALMIVTWLSFFLHLLAPEFIWFPII